MTRPPFSPPPRTSRILSWGVTGTPASVGAGPASGGPSSPPVQDAAMSATTTTAMILDLGMRPHRVREEARARSRRGELAAPHRVLRVGVPGRSVEGRRLLVELLVVLGEVEVDDLAIALRYVHAASGALQDAHRRTDAVPDPPETRVDDLMVGQLVRALLVRRIVALFVGRGVVPGVGRGQQLPSARFEDRIRLVGLRRPVPIPGALFGRLRARVRFRYPTHLRHLPMRLGLLPLPLRGGLLA